MQQVRLYQNATGVRLVDYLDIRMPPLVAYSRARTIFCYFRATIVLSAFLLHSVLFLFSDYYAEGGPALSSVESGGMDAQRLRSVKSLYDTTYIGVKNQAGALLLQQS